MGKSLTDATIALQSARFWIDKAQDKVADIDAEIDRSDDTSQRRREVASALTNPLRTPLVNAQRFIRGEYNELLREACPFDDSGRPIRGNIDPVMEDRIEVYERILVEIDGALR